MINFFKKEKKKSMKMGTLIAPIDGKVIDLNLVEDKVFSEKIVGDGIAIISTGTVVKAPSDGLLKMIFETNHAFALVLDDGTEVMVHIGLDTVELKGEGFKRLEEVGTRVKKGQPIIEIDRDIIIGKGYLLVTPLLILNMDSIEKITYSKSKTVIAGIETVLEYELK